MNVASVVPPLLALVFAPLSLGIINRTKAIFAGRVGPPLLQLYYDLWKLLNKGAVYSRTTTLIFRAGPMIGLSALIVAVMIVPFGSIQAPIHFTFDWVLLVYLLGLARIFTVLAALDTGSPFEGMGASREVLYSALAEPAMLLGLAAVAREANTYSLSEIHSALSVLQTKTVLLPVLVLVAIALSVIYLSENSRIPVDDPNTHLELTMVHEVMILDHGGPDLAFILYTAALKMWVLGSLIIGVVFPIRFGYPIIDVVLGLASMFGMAVAVGIVESTVARIRLLKIPQLLIGAAAISGLALLLEFGGNLL